MISKRKDPDILDTSKPILDPPVYPDMQQRTPGIDIPSDKPDLLIENENNDDVTSEVEDVTIIGLENEDDEDEDYPNR